MCSAVPEMWLAKTPVQAGRYGVPLPGYFPNDRDAIKLAKMFTPLWSPPVNGLHAAGIESRLGDEYPLQTLRSFFD